ncbi:MAG TPA: hypothetical protein VKM55_08265 [Candidatus Lokiarchaeia archaeon]|nr:hypothetical protein [Candidatus Lokiarchaeia archaeon]
MSSEDASTVAKVLDLVQEKRPERIDGLVQELSEKLGSPKSEIISLLREMVKSGSLPIHQAGSSSWLDHFLAEHAFLKKLFMVYASETLIKALAFVIVMNLLSWVMVEYFQNSVILAWPRIVILGTAFLFLPGFSLTIEWYPFPSTMLDFARLKNSDDSLSSKSGDVEDKKGLDFLARVGYSICYSLALVVLLGFLIGLMNYGFNTVILHGCFTAIEALVIIDVLFKIKKIHDPFLTI